MKQYAAKDWGVSLRFLIILVLAVALGSIATARPTPKPTPSARLAQEPDASLVWKYIEADPVQSVQPSDWQANPPSKEAVAEWKNQEWYRLIALANRCRDFYTKFPDFKYARMARDKEWQALAMALQAKKEPNLEKRLNETEANLLNGNLLTRREQFNIRSAQVQRNAQGGGEYEKGIRELMKEFPEDIRAYNLLFTAIKDADPAHARAVGEEILQSNASPDLKTDVANFLKSVDILNKPLVIKFKAMDNSQVDIQNMKGKVVLVDFWATWCGPCVAGMAGVKEAFEKFHEKGFEIVGINFDKDLNKLAQFIRINEMPWPQYYDGKGWQNQFAERFGIDAIPKMWLVDKKGILRDTEARRNLQTKIENLLAEPY